MSPPPNNNNNNYNTSSPQCLLFPPQTQPCSGRGICIADGICQCTDIAFTGIGDFFKGSESCDINKDSVMALWSILVIAHSFSLLYALNFIKIKMQSKRNQNQNRFCKSHVPSGIVIAIINILFMTLGCLRASNVDGKIIGTSVDVTVLFSISTSAFWIYTNSFAYDFLQLNVLQAKMKDENTRKQVQKVFGMLKFVMPFCSIFSTVTCCLPLGMLNNNNIDQVTGLATSHYALSGIVILIQAPLVVGMIVPVIGDLKEAATLMNSNSTGQSDADAKLKALLAKLTTFKTNTINNALINVTLAGLFCWPYLQRQSSIFLPIAWSSCAFILVDSMHTLNPRTGASSGSSTSGMKNTNNKSSSATVPANNGGDQHGLIPAVSAYAASTMNNNTSFSSQAHQ
jgi:hypothetical protein